MNVLNREIIILIMSAATIGFFHTLLGPDHYLPFIAMAKAKKWSYKKTFLITFLCGLGHVGSSVLLGMIGVGLGIVVTNFEVIESMRGTLAAWTLIIFGLVYLVYGIKYSIKNKPHSHQHVHARNGEHTHEHIHHGDHVHVHAHNGTMLTNYVPWTLFVIFVFGPCEPLIPLLMYPAAKYGIVPTIMVTAVFSVVTIATMLGVVFSSIASISFIRIKPLERYSHAFAGGVILLCGCAIQFLGL